MWWPYGGRVDWTRLPLARATVDRAAHRRTEPELLDGAWSAPGTQVLVLADGRLATRAADGRVHLDLRDAATITLVRSDAATADLDADSDPDDHAPTPPEPLVVFLGEADDGAAFLALVVDSAARLVGGEDLTWDTLRDIGHRLDDRDAGLAAAAVGLAAWHERHPRCARCGGPTVPALGGWTRRCTLDGSDHYPRTDPAVIMAVVDDDDRLLLGHGAQWPERRFSTLAGFVEPGESAEGAVRREVLEEVGVPVTDVVYRGSQPWPFPASLMLAFVARATSTVLHVDGEEVTDARWFTRAELEAAVAGGDVLLPMRTSVARALIEEWFGGDVGGHWS
ncbi:MAG: NAD(+) diphosphatase [Cellulomonadaceae bacterium]|nr:NAD(+) diphosphatase [Cellulomonadaceae bacterium]